MSPHGQGEQQKDCTRRFSRGQTSRMPSFHRGKAAQNRGGAPGPLAFGDSPGATLPVHLPPTANPIPT
eukprot:scaffold3070_cov133-Isochrysis_galbana.AAC.2